MQVTDDGRGRRIAAKAQVIGEADQKTLADQLLSIRLAKQVRDNYPKSAIVAFAQNADSTTVPAVYVGLGATIVGDVRSKGPIQFQQGFVLNGQTYVLGNIAQDGTGSAGYLTYRAGWGTSYSAEPLSRFGTSGSSQLTLSDVTLAPSATNPMGVFQYTGDVVLNDNVAITGTLVVKGNLSIGGTGVQLLALTQATDVASGKSFNTSFPAVVADGSITFASTADVVRVSGLIVASGDVTRVTSVRSGPMNLAIQTTFIDPHDHTVSITDPTVDVFETSDGPAIYVKGAMMANRISLQQDTSLPFALVFDAGRTDTTDAPGFFTWKAMEWTEGN